MLDPKIILITGANRGIGFSLSKKFAHAGYWVIMSGRTLSKVSHARSKISGGNIFTLEIDVSSTQSVRTAAELIRSEFDHVDVLINNAAILPGSQNSTIENEKALEETFNINVFGSWRMIKEFHQLLQKSDDPRIINISSGMGAMDGMGGSYLSYRLSKVALNGLTAIVQADLGTGTKVVSVCPGWVKTDMGGTAAPRDPDKAADGILWLAESSEVKGGKFYRDKKIINW